MVITIYGHGGHLGTISSPCEPDGSGELKMYTPVNQF